MSRFNFQFCNNPVGFFLLKRVFLSIPFLFKFLDIFLKDRLDFLDLKKVICKGSSQVPYC